MARKTIADLENELEAAQAENKELKSQPAELVTTKAQLKHSKESEDRLMAQLQAMEEGDVDTSGCLVFTPDEYREYSLSKGRVMGRKPNQKTECSIEELRALINSNWKPSMVMEKHGLSEEDLKQLIWKLSLKELRDKPVKLNFKGDFFGREG